MRDHLTAISLQLPKALRERVRRIAKERCTTTTALIVEALTEKADALDEKRRISNELSRRDQDARRRALTLVDTTALSPKPTDLPPNNRTPQAPVDDDLPEEVYQQYVEDIVAVTDPVERRMAAQVAIKKIREYHPLTAPDDCTIERRLNELLTVKMRESPPPAPQAVQPISAAPTINGETTSYGESSLLKRVFDGFLPKQIDPTNVKTFGSNGLRK